MSDSDSFEAFIDGVQQSPKYAMFPREFVTTIAREELKKQSSRAKAFKSTRTRLHRVAGAFTSQHIDYAKWLDILKENQPSSSQEHLDTLKQVMRLHASTAERLPFLERVYSDIFSLIPKPETILDLACGLNPLSISWMPVDSKVKYHACDIVKPMLDFLGNYFALVRPNTFIFECNLIHSLPADCFDLVMLLKTMPLLAQLDKTAPKKLLDHLRFKHLIVSYPLKSLGKHDKGMEKNYRTQFETLTAGKNYEIQEYKLPNELFFIISHHD